ncbi:MAG: hypothetical protein RSD99_30545, partial [Janthinobacterium sp.]
IALQVGSRDDGLGIAQVDFGIADGKIESHGDILRSSPYGDGYADKERLPVRKAGTALAPLF